MYLRVVDLEGAIHVALVIAKTKVAYIKRLSILHLKLCGAVILVRLLCHVAKNLGISPLNIFSWVVSRVTMGWLLVNPRQFLAFVSNRVTEI